MTLIYTLPEELLFSILDRIDSVAQLTQCRLTCTRWNGTAETVMFGKKITIKTENQAATLHRHLLQDPSKVSLIRHLHFQLFDRDISPALEQLMHLAITPKIQRLSGSVKSDTFFTTLFAIADKTRSGFDQLKDVPAYTGTNEIISDKKHLKFKNAIHTLNMEIATAPIGSSFIHWEELLDQFLNLTTFTLKAVPIQFQELDAVIKKCHHLQYLGLEGIDHSGQNVTKRMSREQLAHWMASHVQKEGSLQTISITETAFYPEFYEYLLFKYPNVSAVSNEKRVWWPAYDIDIWVAEDFNRVLDAFKTVSQKRINLLLPSNFQVELVGQFAASRQEAIRLDTITVQGQNRCLMTIN